MNASRRSIDRLERLRPRVLSLLALFAAVALLSACAAPAGGGARASPSSPGTRSTGVGSGLSVDEALASGSGEKLLVKGYLFVDRQGRVKLCSALAESDSPACAGSSLAVEGLDLGTVPGLATSGGTRWSTSEVKLVGYVRDGVLRVSANTSA